MRGRCAPVKSSRLNVSWQNSLTFPDPRYVRLFNASKLRGCCFVAGGGTFVQSRLWQSFSDPLVELLSDHPESQFDLLETRHALEGIAAYYAALRSNDEDRERIRELHQAIERAQQSGDLDAESDAVVQYQIAVTEAAHNVVLLHLLRCMEPMLAQNVRQNFELLYARREMLPQVSNHRTRIFEAIIAGEPEQAREASHRHRRS